MKPLALALALVLSACGADCGIKGESYEAETAGDGECMRVRVDGEGLGVVAGSDSCGAWSACLVAQPGERLLTVREHEIVLLNETSGGWYIDRAALAEDGTCPLACEP